MSRHTWRVIIRLLIVTFSGLSVLLFFYQSIRNHNYVNGNDLTSYLNSARWFCNGENPFTAPTRRYIYPLFLVWISYPLSFLQNGYFQKAVTAGFWSLVAWFAFFKTIFASWNFTLGPEKAWKRIQQNYFALALIVLLLHPFLQDEFLNGQVNLFVVGSLAGYFFMLQRDRQFWAALFLATAASLKIAPGLCLIFVLLSGHYRVILYFAGLFFLFVLGIPWLINDQSLTYYGYYIDVVLPHIAASDFEHGYRQYSIISTISYAFDIHWLPLVKMVVICLIALLLIGPIMILGRRHYRSADPALRLAFFSALLPVIPLTFPMSEAHHLLILTLPLTVIVAYWQDLVVRGKGLIGDRLALLFILSLAILHLGHIVKPAPFRLIGLLGLYGGMITLLRTRVAKSDI